MHRVDRGRAMLFYGAPLAALLASTTASSAQTIVLPGIVITTPSPVVRTAPQRPRRSETPAVPANAALEAPEMEQTTLPGSLITMDEAFVAVTVATAREIAATQGQTLTDTLQTMPGIAGSTYAPGANRPIIRGLDTFRVRIQENGIGSHDVAAISEDHAVPIDPFAADRVEVIRGPATLRYGSQAIGGVVAVENNRIPTFVHPRGFDAEVRGGFNSVDDGSDGAFKVTAGAAGILVHADAFKRDADDYTTPRGTQENTFVNSEGFAVGSSYVWNDGFIGISFSRLKSRYGVPFGADDHDDDHDEEHGHTHEGPVAIDLNQDRIQSKGEWRVGASGIEAIRYWFGASDYAHDEIVLEEGEVGTSFMNKEIEGRFEIQHLPVVTTLGELRGAIGAQFGHRELKAIAFEDGIDPLLDPARTKSMAAFWFEELQATDKLRLQAAARIEKTKVDGTGVIFEPGADPQPTFSGDRTFVPVSASLGFLYDLPLGVVARLNGQYVERAPDAAELFSKGVHEATGTFEIGNPSLDKEKALTAEVGLKRAEGQFRFDASVYYTQFDGFIFKDKHGRCELTIDTCDPDEQPDHGALDLVRFAQRDATFRGAEIAAEYDVAPIWRGVWGIDGQYDFVRARFEGDNVPRIPPHRLGGGLYYRDSNWFARVGVLHAFRQDKVNIETDELETPGYTLVSAELAYTLRSTAPTDVIQELTIGVKGENLANEEILNHASFKRSENVLLPGASVRLFGSLKLN